MTLDFLFYYIYDTQSNILPSNLTQRFSQALKSYLSIAGNTIEDEIPMYGSTLLIHAARAGKKGIVKVLLSQGAQVNENVFLFGKNNIGILDCLLEEFNKRTPEATQVFLNNILLMSLDVEYIPVIKWALQKGAQVDCKNRNNETALMVGVAKGKFKVVKCLLENKANVNETNNIGWTPLFYAVSNVQISIDIIKLLLQEKALINIKDQGDQTPLMLASRVGYHKAVALLLEQNPMASEEPSGCSALNHAIDKSKMKVVRILIYHGISLRFLFGGLKFRIKTQKQILPFLEETLRLMPVLAPFNKRLISKHNCSMRSYAEKAAKEVAVNTPLPIELAKIVNAYLFQDEVLLDLYNEKWIEHKTLVFSSTFVGSQKRSLPCLEAPQKRHCKR